MAKKAKKVQLVAMKVPADLRDAVQRMISDYEPPKPIKRKEKFTLEDSRKLMKLLKAARPLFNRAVDEFDRLDDDYDFEALTRSDTVWLERYTGRLGSIFNYMNNELDASFY